MLNFYIWMYFVCSNKKQNVNRCSLCGKNVSGSAMFCSEECMERHYDYVLIDIPRRWVENTLVKISCPDRYDAIVTYSKRHSFDLQLLKKKLREKFKIDICRGY